MKKQFSLFLVLAALGLFSSDSFAQTPPATFNDFLVSIRKISTTQGLVGAHEGGLNFSVDRNDLASSIVYVNNVPYTLPANIVQIVISVRRPLLTASPHCEHLIMKKKTVQDTVLALMPTAQLFHDLALASNGSGSIRGSFSSTSTHWMFSLNQPAPALNGVVPLRCNN